MNFRFRALAWFLFFSVSGGVVARADGPAKSWSMPVPAKTEVVTKTIIIRAGETRDFHYTRLVPAKNLGDGSQREAQRPVIALMKGASVRRVIIGAPGADGIHCRGNNVLSDVWFEDVGEDAVTVDGANVQWIGGGARLAKDKIVQLNHKGPFLGQNLYFEDFTTAVRGNGNKSHKETPFRATLRDIVAKDGVCLMRFSNKAARGELERIQFTRMEHLGRADGGSRIVWLDEKP